MSKCRALRVPCGSVETGTVTEQVADVVDANGQRLRCRLITLHLYQPTRDGDRYIQILTNLPTDVSALVVAESYRSRWKIENVNLELVKHFDSEQTSLGNPPATLFAFCVSIVAFHVLQLVHSHRCKPRMGKRPPKIRYRITTSHTHCKAAGKAPT